MSNDKKIEGSEDYFQQIYGDEKFQCDGEIKFYKGLGGTIEQCPRCEHYNAIAKPIHGFLDDFEIDEEENWELWCLCCGNISNCADD